MTDVHEITGSASARRPRRRLLAAAGLYFLIVFAAGLLMGPVRVLWLEPLLGPFLAVLCETPLLVLAMWFGARFAPTATKVEAGWTGYLVLGLIALFFQLIADFAVGFGLRGLVVQDQLAYFATPAGFLYAVSLLIFAGMPILRRPRAPEGRRAR